MLNESLYQLSFDQLKDVSLHELTILHIALVYVLIYVAYKALGRYIYFKPQEHASKINRTFLVIALIVVAIHSLNPVINLLPFLAGYRWLYMLCLIVLLIAPLSIIADRLIWSYDKFGNKESRSWHWHYLPIAKDYYKTSVTKSAHEGNTSWSWEDEAVESTSKNIHSDALLNFLAFITYFVVCWSWALDSTREYGWFPICFTFFVSIPIGAVFFDRAVFSWIDYIENWLMQRRYRKSN